MSGFNHCQDMVWTMGGERLLLEAVINCGNGTPTIQDTNVPGLVVANATTGKIQLTFPAGAIPANSDIANINVDVGNNASSNYTVLYDKTTLKSAGVLFLYCLSAGSAANLPATAELSVNILFKNTSVPRP